MNGLRYFKHMVGVTNRQLAKDMKISMLLANFWTSGYEPISDNHKEELEEVYRIPFSLMKKELTVESKWNIDVAIITSLGKIKSKEDIVFNHTIYFDSLSALGYILFAKDMTKKQLAEKMGISINTIQTFFKKDKEIPKKYLTDLSNILEMPEMVLEGKLYLETKWKIDSILMQPTERKQFRAFINQLNYQQVQNFKEAM